MENYKNKYANSIYLLLNPLLGDYMARSVIKKQGELLNVSPEAFSVMHLKSISENVQKGLTIFIGSGRAQTVAQQILLIK